MATSLEEPVKLFISKLKVCESRKHFIYIHLFYKEIYWCTSNIQLKSSSFRLQILQPTDHISWHRHIYHFRI
ncbi:hypothetical protein Hanom_Chr10g00937571 [Helianthus anomalus]